MTDPATAEIIMEIGKTAASNSKVRVSSKTTSWPRKYHEKELNRSSSSARCPLVRAMLPRRRSILTTEAVGSQAYVALAAYIKVKNRGSIARIMIGRGRCAEHKA